MVLQGVKRIEIQEESIGFSILVTSGNTLFKKKMPWMLLEDKDIVLLFSVS